ncbi:sugar phosphate isomerase/epimerase [Mucilaginibacter corticis]|uniref:Sugar phosphate isomerase/epimerase n=1 Tax=Mucilaginibacter corticis TaxID=2597670 RepID=A0A556MGE6_9SPHI|nr:sugar phosphate isomerase/epimerase [Mucilaginibacter corticis]TSJ38865.1 sugar phosphate isomerase/epimerase [Mucilaginibacter corticis]
MKTNQVSRRRFIGTGALAATGTLLLSKSSFAHAILSSDKKPNSVVNGVQIGVITYSFRSLPGSIQDMLKYCIACNINAIELMGEAAEEYAGIPKHESGQSNDDHRKAVAQWRASVPMDKFKEIRKMYNDAGVSIYAWKPSALDDHNTDDEVIYAFNAGQALGASHVTVELGSAAQTKRLGDLATAHKFKIGYHAHTQATPTLWDTALSQSEYNCINLDAGHYASGTSSSPVPFIEKYHDKIVSMHLKDRKFHDGPNEPWGEGDTPLADILHVVRDKKYKFPVTIEFEYDVPNGSDAVTEVKKCRDFAVKALKA